MEDVKESESKLASSLSSLVILSGFPLVLYSEAELSTILAARQPSPSSPPTSPILISILASPSIHPFRRAIKILGWAGLAVFFEQNVATIASVSGR